MNVTKREYAVMSRAKAPASPVAADCVKAFGIGGAICAAGQMLVGAMGGAGMEVRDARTLCSVILVAASILLTGLGLYDDLARQAGAGTLVPITGFANAVAAPAIEFKAEGFVPGLGAKMFIIAGPVLVYGITASAVYGLILWLINLL